MTLTDDTALTAELRARLFAMRARREQNPIYRAADEALSAEEAGDARRYRDAAR